MSAKIFISYRRNDRAPFATILKDRLERAFGAEMIFMDVAHLLPGEHFAERLAQELEGCDVLIAVMGPNWLSILDERAFKIERDQTERDYAREEIATALQRRLIVVPLLVDGAELPPADRLPNDIRPLILHQVHPFSLKRADRDANELVEAIKALRVRRIKERRASPKVNPKLGQKSSLLSWFAMATAILLITVVGVAVWLNVKMSSEQSTAGTPDIAAPQAQLPRADADGEVLEVARKARSIAAFEDYLHRVNNRELKGTYSVDARRAIADLERWERIDKDAEAALAAYLLSETPLMAVEARAILAKLKNATIADSWFAYIAWPEASPASGGSGAVGRIFGVASRRWAVGLE